MKATLKYMDKNSGVIVEHHNYQRITDARKDAKQFVKNPDIDRVWISIFDGWHWRVKEILKEVK